MKNNNNVLVMILVVIVLAMALHRPTGHYPGPQPQRHPLLNRVVTLFELWFITRPFRSDPPTDEAWYQGASDQIANTPPVERDIDAKGKPILNHGAGW